MNSFFSSPCENFDHQDTHDDIYEITLRKEYGGSVFAWCSTCRQRDADMIVPECNQCGQLLKDEDVHEITGDGVIFCSQCLEEINQLTEDYERTYPTA